VSLPAETLAEEVRDLDKEGPAVASEDGLKLPGEGAEAIAAEVVVAAKIERRSQGWVSSRAEIVRGYWS